MSPSALLFDARALATAAAVVKAGNGDRRAAMEVRFSAMPAHHGFLVVCGVAEALDALGGSSPPPADVALLRTAGLVDESVLERLSRLRLDIVAVDDGTVAFAGEPIFTIEGPLADVVLAASVARRTLARATAVATRTARRMLAAHGVPIIDGASALVANEGGAALVARAAYIGGAAGTTAALVGARLGIPVRATTQDDLADLVNQRVSIPDGWGEGLADRPVDLGPMDDELAILALGLSRAPGGFVSHDLDGLGELSCRADLVALEHAGAWTPRMGAGVDAEVDPGRKMVIRYFDAREAPVGDVIHAVGERIQPASSAVVVGGAGVPASIPLRGHRSAPLARNRLRDGRRVDAPEALTTVRDRAAAQIVELPDGLRLLRRPQRYLVGLSPRLSHEKSVLLAAALNG